MHASSDRTDQATWSRYLAVAAALTAVLAGALVLGVLDGALAIVGLIVVLGLVGFMGYAGRRIASAGGERPD